MHHVSLPSEYFYKKNKQDIDEIKERYLKGLTFHYVDKMEEVIKLALV
jgi:ATP-dependent Lon protease